MTKEDSMGKQKNRSQRKGLSAFFFLAAAFLVLGIPTGNPAFIGPGLFFLIVALSERTGRREDSDPQGTGDA